MKLFTILFLCSSVAFAGVNKLTTQVTAKEALPYAQQSFEAYYLNELASIYPDQVAYTFQQMKYAADVRGYGSIIKAMFPVLKDSDQVMKQEVASTFSARVFVSLKNCEKALGGEVRYIYDSYDYRPEIKLPAVCDDSTFWAVIGSAIQSARLDKLVAMLSPSQGYEWRKTVSLWQYGDSGNLDSLIQPPVVYSSEPSESELLETFGDENISDVISSGQQAIDDFFNAHEGATDPSFSQLKQHLSANLGRLNKIIYIASGDEGYSRNILVIVDKNFQAVSFRIGYSE